MSRLVIFVRLSPLEVFSSEERGARYEPKQRQPSHRRHWRRILSGSSVSVGHRSHMLNFPRSTVTVCTSVAQSGDGGRVLDNPVSFGCSLRVVGRAFRPRRDLHLNQGPYDWRHLSTRIKAKSIHTPVELAHGKLFQTMTISIFGLALDHHVDADLRTRASLREAAVALRQRSRMACVSLTRKHVSPTCTQSGYVQHVYRWTNMLKT